MFAVENGMFAGMTEEGREGMSVGRKVLVETPPVKLARRLKRVELEAESAGRHCSDPSSSR